MGKILVTGASGNVGRFVVKYALKNGDSVKVAGRNVERLMMMFGENVECVKFDFENEDTYQKALTDVDRVFLMRPPYMGNFRDLLPFIQAMKSTGNIKLVSFLSLIGIEHNPMPPHYKIEKALKKSGLTYCFIRPSFYMQNLSGVHAFEIKELNRIVVPVKKAKTSFIDTEDIGELTAFAMHQTSKYQNTALSITGPRALDYYQVADILSKELDRQITYADPEPKMTEKYWIQVRGLDKAYAKVMTMLYFLTRHGMAEQTNNVFETIMHKKPTSFEEFAHKNRNVWIQ